MSAMSQEVADDEAIFISQKDFMIALTKVFPSVSTKDELIYAKLEHSLRKTRGSIEGNSAANAQNA